MIGTLRESHLHAALKRHWAQPGDALEQAVGGYVVDIVRGQHLIEIQTQNLAAMRPKLRALLPQHTIHVVMPVAVQCWIVREDAAGHRLGRRLSPRRGHWLEVFAELVSAVEFLPHPNLHITVALVHTEEVRRPHTATRRTRWPKAWRTVDRRLLAVLDTRPLHTSADYLQAVPTTLADPFTSRQLAEAWPVTPALAQKITYTLSHSGWLAVTGQHGRARLWQRLTGVST